jgi:hypothetical protein
MTTTAPTAKQASPNYPVQELSQIAFTGAWEQLSPVSGVRH